MTRSLHASPPRWIPVVAPALARQLEDIERLCTAGGPPAVHLESSLPAQLTTDLLQSVLCDAVYVDCFEITDTATLYSRILHQLATWPLQFDEMHRGVECWDNRGRDAMAEDGEWLPAAPAPSNTGKGILAAHANESFAAFAAALELLWAFPTCTRRTLVLSSAQCLASLSDPGPVVNNYMTTALTRLAAKSAGRCSMVFVVPCLERQSSSTVANYSGVTAAKLTDLTRDDLLGLICHAFTPGHGVPRLPLQPAAADSSIIAMSGESQRMLYRALVEATYDIANGVMPHDELYDSVRSVSQRLWPSWISSGSHRHLPDLLSAHKSEIQLALENHLLTGISSKGGQTLATTATLARCLPITGKLILLAAYLAGKQPARDDARLFAVTDGGARKASKASRRPALRTQDTLVGGKSATVERVVAIYDVLLDAATLAESDDNVEPHLRLARASDAYIGHQLATLLSLGLVSRTGTERLDVVRIRCELEREDLAALAKSMSLKLDEYTA